MRPHSSAARAARRTPTAIAAPRGMAATLASLLALPLALGAPAPASAAETAAPAATTIRHYAIAPGPMARALSQFATEAGILLSVDAMLVAGIASPGLTGSVSIEQGFARLLAGSGLETVVRPGGGYMLRRTARNTSAVTTLQAITVTHDAERDAADRPFQTPASTTHLSQQHIERFRGSSVGDMFQGTPGVLIAENRNSGGLDVNIRGMQGQGRVPVLVDGSRQESTVYRGYGGIVSRSYVDPDLIGGIDISKGPVMTAEGAGATGGVVSMRTLDADDILRPGQTSGIRIRGSLQGNSSSPPPAGTAAGFMNEYATYRVDCAAPSMCEGAAPPDAVTGVAHGMNRPGLLDLRSWAGSIAAARRFDRADVVVAYSQRRQGTYYTGTHGAVPSVALRYTKLPFYTEVTPYHVDNIRGRFRGGERVVNSNNHSNTWLLKSRLYLPADQTLDLSYMRYASEYGELMPSVLAGLGNIRQTSDSSVAANTFSGRYRWNPAGNDWLDLRANVWLTRTKSVNRNYPDELNDPGLVTVMTPERYTRRGGDVSNTMRAGGWGRHTLDYGLTAQSETIHTALPSGADQLVGSFSGRNGERREFSLFANWQWEPLPGLKLDAGLRYTRAEAEDYKKIVPSPLYTCTGENANGDCNQWTPSPSTLCQDLDGDGACDPITRRTRNSGTAPVISLSWEPWQNGLQFYARHAEALRMPSMFESTAGWSVTPSLSSPLGAERAVNREVGVNWLKRDAWLPGDRMAVKLARFHNRTRDYLTRTSPSLGDADAGAFFVLRNIDKVELHGTELTLEYDMGRVYGKLGATYYDHTEVCHTGSYRRERCTSYGLVNSYFNNMIPPRWHGSALIGTRWLDRRLDAGVRATFVGRRSQTPDFDDDTARGMLYVIPWRPYTLVDLYASWHYSEQVSVHFNIDNLTDRYYYDALGLGFVPSPGRTARLSVTLKY